MNAKVSSVSPAGPAASSPSPSKYFMSAPSSRPSGRLGENRKIVHFLFEPGDGGLDRVAILLASEMADRGIDSELWLAQRSGPTACLIDSKVKVRLVPTLSFGSRGLRLFFQIPALAKMIRAHRPAVILSAGNQSNLPIALARQLARFGRTGRADKSGGASSPTVIQKITNPVIRPGMGFLRAFFRRKRFSLTANLGDCCLTLSEADARSCAALMPKAAGRFVAVRNAYVTDAMLIAGKMRKPRAANDAVKLLAIGRLAVQKDYPTLLRALAKIKQHRWQLTILGDGPLFSELQDLSSHLSLTERIIFRKYVPDPVPFYAASDILILSSRWEGFPAVPLEAIASGCDIVATDCSAGLAEIMRRIGCQPTAIGDDTGLALAIEQSIKRREPKLLMREIAAEYSLASSVEDHLRIIARYVHLASS